ncbi:hypothetical protein NXC24_PC02088 (plasmid) [Rhizobium sp. NXC24]|nr:hypothetical protein NXC24_PC02088 [Rhizobium sp. NXC24]
MVLSMRSSSGRASPRTLLLAQMVEYVSKFAAQAAQNNDVRSSSRTAIRCDKQSGN